MANLYNLVRSAWSTTDPSLANGIISLPGVFDSNFPLYGKFKLSDIDFTDDKPRVWVDPEILNIIK
jgi:hypothetical protein